MVLLRRIIPFDAASLKRSGEETPSEKRKGKENLTTVSIGRLAGGQGVLRKREREKELERFMITVK